MTDYKTTHFDVDHESIGKQMIVLEAFKQMASVFGTDVIGASKTTPIVSGIENPASTLSSKGQIYTTVPLRPLDGDVNFLPENYLQVRFNFTVETILASTTWNDGVRHDLAIWFPSSACIPSRLQLMCGNAIVWQNQFQRYEACCALASIKASYLDGDPEYASVRKIQDGKQFPGIIVTIPQATPNPKLNFTLNLTIDLSQLTPLLSNIPFITNDMGDVRLRIFFEHLERGMCCCWLNNYVVPSSAKQLAMIGRYPLTKGTILNVPNTDASGIQDFTIDGISWDATGGFGVQIVQSCFKLDDVSKMAIAKFIGQDNKLMIPTQAWSTVQSTTSSSSNNSTQSIFQVSAYNISLLAFLFPFFSVSDVVLPNPFMQSIDIQLNSKSLNFIPYDYVDNRVLKDTTQAFLNNDKYAFNEVLKNSLIPTFMESVDYTNSFAGVNISKNNSTTFIDENNYVQAVSCAPVNSFQKGMCLASSNPQSTQIRFKYTVTSDVRNKIWNTNSLVQSVSGIENPLSTDYGNAALNSPPAYCCALQDCLIVLDYNPVIGACQSGSVYYTEPITV